jgi:hypothetical protein
MLMTHEKTKEYYKKFLVITTILPLFDQLKEILRKHKFLGNVEVAHAG